MKKIHKKILRLQKEKATRIAEYLRYTSKSFVTLNVYDEKRAGFFRTKCNFSHEERLRRDLAQKVPGLAGSKIRKIVTKVMPFHRGERKRNIANRKKHQGFQFKFLAYDALRSSL